MQDELTGLTDCTECGRWGEGIALGPHLPHNLHLIRPCYRFFSNHRANRVITDLN